MSFSAAHAACKLFMNIVMLLIQYAIDIDLFCQLSWTKPAFLPLLIWSNASGDIDKKQLVA